MTPVRKGSACGRENASFSELDLREPRESGCGTSVDHEQSHGLDHDGAGRDGQEDRLGHEVVVVVAQQGGRSPTQALRRTLGEHITLTANVTVDQVYAEGRPGLAPGRYARLRVSDTGTRMPPEVLARVFEPLLRRR